MDIKKVGVVGCGTMGGGIAQVCAQAGCQVHVLEADRNLLEKGLANVKAFLDKGVQKGKMSAEERDAVFGRIKGSTDLSGLSGCQLVIEAVVENIEIKKGLFSKLDEVLGAGAILATNTSSLSIVDMAAATGRPDKVLGIHFFNPAPLMQLVEIVETLLVSGETMEKAKEFVRSLGKKFILAKDLPGFIVNYLQYPFRLHAIRMVEKGLATPEDIDKAARLGLGHPMGPLELQDLVGLDITYNACLSIYQETNDPAFLPPVLMKKMIAAGRLGRKTGQGFYAYKDGKYKDSGRRLINKEVPAI